MSLETFIDKVELGVLVTENGEGAEPARWLSETVRVFLKLACVCIRGKIKCRSRRLLTLAPGRWAASNLRTAAYAPAAPGRDCEGRRVLSAGRRSGQARRCRGGKL